MVTTILRILHECDPLGLAGDDRPEEYSPEAERIEKRLSFPCSFEEVLHVVHSVFIECFDVAIAGPEERYRSIAERIFQLPQNSSQSASQK